MAKKLAQVSQKECVACGCCVKVCPLGAVRVHEGMSAKGNFHSPGRVCGD